MTRKAKKILAYCFVFILCFCNIPDTTITSQAAAKKATSIKLNASTQSLTVGQTYQLKVKTIKPSGADKSVTWKSSNSKVAKVSSKGKVTAKKAGKATITATSKTNKKVKATCKITVYSKATKVSLNYKSKEIKTGESFQLKATVSPKKANQGITYSSSNTKIATVTKNGKVTGKKAGKATITVRSTTNKTKKATCVVTVNTTVVPTATATPTKIPTATSVPTIAPTATSVPTPTITNSPTATSVPMPTITNSPTATSVPTPTITNSPTATSVPTPTITNSPTVTSVPTPTVTNTPTATSVPTPTVTNSPTVTSVPTPTVTSVPTPTVTNAPTATSVPTPTVTNTPTATSVPTPTATNSPTVVPTATSVPTPTVTNPPTATNAPDENDKELSGPRIDAEGNVTYDCIYFGSYPQSDATGQTKEPIKWRILSIDGTEAFLVADQNLDVYAYNEKREDVTWETSTIRSWLNGYSSEANACGIDYSSDNFINRAFTSTEQEAIPYVTVVNEDSSEYGTEGGNDTLDKIYLLSVSEVSNAAYGFLPYKNESASFIDDNARKRTNTAYAAAGGAKRVAGMSPVGCEDWWWLRSPGRGALTLYVNRYGTVDWIGRENDYPNAVCPALHLDLSSTNVWSNAGTITIETSVSTATPTQAPTATSVPTPTVTQAPEENDGSTSSGGNYEGLSGPRTDAEGNVTYDCVYFGSYPQSDATGQTKEPIKWRILSINGTEAFLVADQNLDVYRYNEEWTDVTWETSTIRSWLNGYGSEANACGIDYSSDNFINRAFTSTEQEAIPYVTVVNEDNPEYGTEGGNDTLDKIYLLSISEVSNAAYGFLPYKNESASFICDNAKKRTNTAYVAAGGTRGVTSMSSVGCDDWWWLRSPGDYGSGAAYVYDDGVRGFGHRVDFTDDAVCPALHLNLSSTNVWSNAGTVTIER